jgi:uracil-DNA glycosylase
VSAADELEAIAQEIRTHRGCGFEICEQATNLVPGEGSGESGVVLVGEAPGAREDATGRPFVGAAGKLLDALLEEAGLDRSTAFITNVVKARPPGNRDPKPAEVAHHRPWLERQLAAIEPRLVVPLGRHALAHFAPGLKISETHGRPVSADGYELFPLYHPAAALRGRALRETLFADARTLGEALRARAG